MNLKEFKNHIESFPNGTLFENGISYPFSWRGSYDEVAFSILDTSMTKTNILDRIQQAYDEVFTGYKGGEYHYNDWTDIHFEESIRDYTDGGYCGGMIAKIEGRETYKSQEERLVKIAFKSK